jgi:hypothetical protein
MSTGWTSCSNLGVRSPRCSGRNMSPCFPELVDELTPIPPASSLPASSSFWSSRMARSGIGSSADTFYRIHVGFAKPPSQALQRSSPSTCFGRWRRHPQTPAARSQSGITSFAFGKSRVRYARHMNDSSAEIWQLALQVELDGIVAKGASAPYTPGRTMRCLKIKTEVGTERERLRRPR